MKNIAIYRFIIMVIVAIVPLPASGDSMPILAESRSVIGHSSDGYTQKLPRQPRLRESVENDVQQANVDSVQALKERQAELSKDDTDNELYWLFLSGITFSGFILAVWALGTLICCRPPVMQNPRSMVLSEGSCRQVIWLVILIAVLNMYDLTCTLFASNVGGLWELNPLASPILHQNSGIIVFKLGLTVGAAILLMVTRRHRLAYISSWWTGVLYTVLILRWTTFNSMFL